MERGTDAGSEATQEGLASTYPSMDAERGPATKEQPERAPFISGSQSTGRG